MFISVYILCVHNGAIKQHLDLTRKCIVKHGTLHMEKKSQLVQHYACLLFWFVSLIFVQNIRAYYHSLV